MGRMSDLTGRRVYLDANVFIYAKEGLPPMLGVARALFDRIDNGAISAVTSELTLAEVLVAPIRQGDTIGRHAYVTRVASGRHLTVEPVSRDILLAAAEIRATTHLKLPDAIHGATALHAGCTHIMTNVAHLRDVPGIEVVVLGEIDPSE